MTLPLRVCHLIAPGPLAGAEKVVLTGCAELLRRKVTLELAAIRESRSSAAADQFLAAAHEAAIPSHGKLQSTKRLDFQLLRDLREYLRQGEFDIVHTHGYKAFLFAPFALPPQARHVHTMHGDTSRGLSVRLYQWLVYRRLKYAGRRDRGVSANVR